MPYVVRFTPTSLNAARYDDTIQRLAAAGAGNPQGRNFHVAFGDPNELRVSDIWDTRENFESFGATLMPILESVGVDPGTPDIIEIYNIINGS